MIYVFVKFRIYFKYKISKLKYFILKIKFLKSVKFFYLN